MSDQNTKHRISSFAAPTVEDLAVLATMSPEERRALIDAEIAKGFEGKTTIVTDNLKKQILREAFANVKTRNDNG